MPRQDKTSKNNDLVLSSYIKLMRAADSITNRSHRHLSDVKLSFSQFAVIEALYHLGPLCQRDIATKILKSSRNITMVVDNLEKRNLVLRERDAGDRRYLNVRLTDEGRALFESIYPRHVEFLKGEMEILSAGELEELGRLCRILGTRKR
ncbi:MAG: MarR family transcriptional regulator [Deltaproteobacteria bacterium]|nr:MarR family transcriptional regulator [Deltaproteobacteria bacterium]